MTMDDNDRPGDDALLDELRSLADRVDPVPAQVAEGALAAFTWRRVDAELAELLADSAATPDEALAGARGDGARSLTFGAGGRTVEVDVVPEGRAFRLVGQLVPAGSAALVVRHAGGSLDGAADELGRFALGPVPAGQVSLRWVPAEPGGIPVETEWLTL
jgi:hypothetical protein